MEPEQKKSRPWWRSLGPALITACVVFGPGSLLISSKVGAEHGYTLLWILLLTGTLMGTYVTMAARVGVVGGATPCTLLAQRLGRPFAALIGINLCLICTAFQFSNNLAVAAAADTLGVAQIFGDPAEMPEETKDLINSGVLLGFNGAVISFVFLLRQVYRILERTMKFMVGLILVCFLINLVVVHPQILKVLEGFIPGLPSATEQRIIFSLKSEQNGDVAETVRLPALQEKFAGYGRRLSPEAEIIVLKNGKAWRIKDHGKTYTLIKEGNALNVHRGTLLFSVPGGLKSELKSGDIPAGMRVKFEEQSEGLSADAKVSYDEEGGRWLLKSGGSKESGSAEDRIYTVLEQNGFLSVYEGVAFVAPLLLIASLLGTTFSVAGAFYQGNLVREKGWKLEDYRRGFSDAVAGVCVLTGVSAMIMVTSATVLRDAPASDIGVLANQLRPLLGRTSHIFFCIGLLAVAMNPFVINSMIGGSILADGIGKTPKLSDPWPRRFTVGVLLVGMIVAMLVLHTPVKKVDAIVFGQALTVVGNPLMAATLLYLANKKDVMGSRRNGVITNILGAAGLVVVVVMAVRILLRLIG